MRPQGCQETHPRPRDPAISCNSHISNRFLGLSVLTLPKTETYTRLMNARRILATTVVLLTVVLLQTPAPLAQAVQRSIYVSVLDAAGAPVPDLGPGDF